MSVVPPLDVYAVYVAAAVALILTPGPDTVFVLAQGAGGGRRAGASAGLGVATGVLGHTLAVSLGLAALLRASPTAFTLLQYAGAAYLCYLGVQTLRGAGGGIEVDPADAADGDAAGTPFRQGATVNLLNPKVAIFFLAFLPGFAGDGGAPRLAFLGVTYAVLAAVYLGAVGTLAGRVRSVFESPRATRALRYVSGVAVVGLGVLVVAGAGTSH
ncbi:LysE family translocator [Halospeciosus flavus]|uniref:LysE family translocator n=1 Tax=Halospeciosus flavus TaxID=3032283 RepID=A0ABD5Z839_9EURY|nr:LysE family translocator [Halospeciosus flavus]